jgi:acetyl esterase/lipase
MRQVSILMFVLLNTLLGWLAAAQPAQPPPERIAYASAEPTQQRLDIYTPAEGEAPYPTVFMIHGGGFVSGGLDTLTPLARLLQAEGYAVVNITYRLVPRWLHPSAVEDSFCALAWMTQQADDYGLDMERVFLLGESAGGYLVTRLATAEPDDYLAGCESSLTDITLRGVVAYYPLVDYTADDFQPIGGGLALSLLNGANWWEGILTDEYEDDAAALSLLPDIDGDEPPFLLIHGERDSLVPVSQSTLLGDALEKVDVSVETQMIAGADHGFAGRVTRGAGAEAAALMVEFLAGVNTDSELNRPR